LSFFYTTSSIAKAGDELVINESLVNMRAGPSAEDEVLLKLKQDRKVTEIQRQGSWVEIETHREDIKTGWIHKTLLSKATISKNTSSPSRLDNFMQRFNDMNEVITKQNGVIYFSNVKHIGKGQLEVIATQAWINSNIETRNNTLSEIFKFWSEVSPVGSSISIQVFDEQGDKFTLMMR